MSEHPPFGCTGLAGMVIPIGIQLPCGERWSAGAEPGVHVDLVEAFELAGVYLAGLDALEITDAPVGEMTLQRIGQLVQALDPRLHPGEALHSDDSRLTGVRLIGHSGHEGSGMPDMQAAPKACGGRLEGPRRILVFRLQLGVWIINARLLDAGERPHAQDDCVVDFAVGHDAYAAATPANAKP